MSHSVERTADLTAYARVRNAALAGFAARGVAATSIRDVAVAAGVSPGLVQHHFGTKARLREAVNEYVHDLLSQFSRDLAERSAEQDAWPALGDATTAWVRDNEVVLRYIARAVIDGDEEAAKAFEVLVGIARQDWLAPLDRAGRLRQEADRDWAALHAVMFNLASVLLEPAISRHLPAAFGTPEQLQRWNRATVDLYRNGLAKPDA